jgi:hypothetical protein
MPSQTPTDDSDRPGLILSALTVIGLLMALAAPLLGQPEAALLGLCLTFAAGGIPAFAEALDTLIEDRVLDIDLLMVLAAVAAAAVGAALEGAVLLTLFSVSGTLEHLAMGKARRAVEALMALRPETALKLAVDGSVTEVAVAGLVRGDRVIVRPGARMPVDGVIREGQAGIDEATVTGESVPVSKGPGAPVFEATVNLNGVLTVEVTKPSSESTVARMIQLVTQAQAAKAPSERFSAWFGQRYTVVVLLGSLACWGALLALGWASQDALYRAATLLVAASPCAIVISVPAAILSALSASARGGVLFKGGAALENLAGIGVVRVNFDRADPPGEVIDSFRAVQAAQQERDRLEKEADAYANRVTAGARGESARLLEESEAYRAQVVNNAQGEASRFQSVYEEYVKAPDVTRRRMYLETMERVFGDMNKIILDGVGGGEQAGQGVVPFLPLNELGRMQQGSAAAATTGTATTAGAGGN